MIKSSLQAQKNKLKEEFGEREWSVVDVRCARWPLGLEVGAIQVGRIALEKFIVIGVKKAGWHAES